MIRDSGTDLADYNTFASEAKAVEYDENNTVIPFDHGYTGQVVTGTVSNLADIKAYIASGDAHPDNLYVLTYNQTGPIEISSVETLATSGHIRLVRGSTNGSSNTGFMFQVNSGGTLNIGSPTMTGTIELDGGAVYTKVPNKQYNFATERKSTKNFVQNESGDQYRVLFNDGEDYSVAHWYKVTGTTSKRGLITTPGGTLNIYDNVRIGNVFVPTEVTRGKSGAIFNPSGTVNMHGGEISWNAMGTPDDNNGSAIYVGAHDNNPSTSAEREAAKNATLTIYDGLITNNVGLDSSGSYSSDGGAIGIDYGTMYIYGGKITNTRGGYANTGGSGANGGAISGRSGAKIYMYGGEISNNHTGCVGGGVALWYASFYMYGGIITKNYAIYGGGIGMSTKDASKGCEIELHNNATISENYAEYGGGISAGGLQRGYSAKLTMLDGNIINNTAITEGGGICNYNYINSSLDIRGGNISNNKAPRGAGISILNKASEVSTATTEQKMAYLLHLSGGVSINTNNEIYISSLNKIETTEIINGVSGDIYRYQTPIYVKERLNATGTVGMIKLDNYSKYVGTTNSRKNVLDLVKFVKPGGGALEVQNNKFAIDTNEYILNEVVENSTLRLAKIAETSQETFVARLGDRVYTSLIDAVTAAQDGDTIYVINNITLRQIINIDKNIKIVSETTKTKNDSNILDKNLKDSEGNLITPSNQSNLNFTYQALGDYTISLASNFGSTASNTAGFSIKNGGKLTLGDSQYDELDISISQGGYLAVDGNSGHDINGPLIMVNTGGSLEANAGVTLTNNKISGSFSNGACVKIQAGASFELNGATISNNISPTNGGGVYVKGNFLMKSGTIKGNEALNGAGVFVEEGGTCTILNGTISNNDASNDGAGIYVTSGGSAIINSGVISNNTADNDGAGIFVAAGASCEIKAGEIKNNRTVNGNGAGIYLSGTATISGGILYSNAISTYNESPKGEGIFVNDGSELHVLNSVVLDEENPVYITSGNFICIDNSLTTSKAIPIVSEQNAYGTKIAKIHTTDETIAKTIETNTLTNKSIYEVTHNNPIVGKEENGSYYLIYDSIGVTYNINNGKSGDVPEDNQSYSGGDVVNIKPINSEDPLVRDGYVFIGWSPVQVSPVTSAANEIAVKIYYPTDLVDGVTYNHEYNIFEETIFYAVWAVDANRNGTPDYRENVLDITIAPSINGSMSSNLNEAQGGMFVLLTASPADGYEVDTIEVRYTLNGVEGVYSLNNNKVIKLDEKLFYFNMPLADATVYTTFRVQTINEVKITWNDGSEEEWGTLQSALNEIKSNTSKQGRKITLLKYVYSRIETNIPEGVNVELDLGGYTLDMNHLPFVINEGATLKVSDSLGGGKILFNNTGGNNNVANNIVNNGTLNITGGLITMDAGDDSAHYLIENNGTLTMSAGSIKHNDENGIAIYNNGDAILTGGNINGEKYGIYQANTSDNSLDISGFGPINAYGINLDNFISSVYIAKDTFINVSGVINNCGEDNSVSSDNKIPLYLDNAIGINEPIIKSNRVETMVRHFRMHFDLMSRPNNEIAVNSSNEAVLIDKLGKLFTSGEEVEYEYRTDMTLNAQLYKSDNTTPYVGATGTVYFFLLDTVAQWHDVWRPDLDKLVFRDGWGLENAVGSAPIDSTTGLATCTISTEDLDLQNYYIFAMYYGSGTYDSYSVDGPVTSGYVGPVVSKNEQQGQVEVVKKDIDSASVTVNSTASKTYNGLDQKSNIEIQVYDGEHLLVEDTDYEITMPSSIVNVGDYTISIIGIGKYKNARNINFSVQKYNGQISISGINLKYAAGSIPSISFDGASPSAIVKDSNNNTLEYGTDYDIKYFKMSGDQYVEISSLQSTAGVYKVEAICKSTSPNYANSLTAEAAFVISSDGAQYEATIENDTLTYNGRERSISELGTITVSGRASATAEEETLTRDVDYTVMFGTSSVKNAGTYPVIIQGKGDYAELVNIAVDFTIAKKVLTKDNTEITFDNSDLEYEYNGKAIIPSIQSIVIDGVDTTNETGTPLVAGSDYVISISGDNIKVNAVDPQLLFTTLNGNYAITTLSYPFHINPRSLTDNNNAQVSIYQSGFSGVEVIPVVTLIDRVGGISKKLTDDDYEVTYRVNTTANDGATLSPNGYPLNKGTYDAVITGKGNYTGSKVETFIVGNYRGRIIATLEPNVFTYTGNDSALHGSIISSLTVTRGDSISGELIYGTDYILGYGTPDTTVAPSEVGEYLLYIVGIGNYDEVQTTTTYQISPLTGTVNIVLNTDSLLYNGKIQRPIIDTASSYLKVNGENVYLNSLQEGRDYAVIIDEGSKNVGGYVLQVNGIGRYAGNYNFASYQIAPRPINDDSITIKSIGTTDKEYNGQEHVLSFTPSGDAWLEYQYDENEAPIILVEGTDFTVVHSNNTNGGTAVAVIAGIGNYGDVRTYNFVIESKPINSGDNVADGFTLTGIANKAYTGSACTQDFVLTDTVLNTSLIEGVDYTVTYTDNIEVGTASYKIEAKGNYKGTIRGTFEIAPISIANNPNVIVEVLNNNNVYNSTYQAPTVLVGYRRNDSTVQLHENVDYELVHGTNEYTNAGTYTFSIKGKAGSNYTDSLDATYTIVPYTGNLNVSLSQTIYTNGVTKQEIENNLVVTYGSETLSIDQLDILYTPEELTTGNYTIEVKAKSTLPNYYESSDSRAYGYTLFAIEGADAVSLSLLESTHVYTGGTIVIPESNMIINGEDSIADLRADPANKDLTYMVSWDRPIKEVGTYLLTVRILKGNNELQNASTTYTVTPKNIDDADVLVDDIPDQIYTGSFLRPEVRLEYNEEVLTSNDFTAVYAENKNIGEATVTLVGKGGNFIGERILHFDINKESQGDIIITLTQSGDEVTNSTYTYDSYAKTPDVIVDYVVAEGDRRELVEGTDYTVSYESNTNAGTARAIVTLCGNYSGSASKDFKINKYNLSAANIFMDDTTVYNGRVQKPEIVVRRDNVLLTLNVDYEVAYDGSFINADSYSLILIRAMSGDTCNYNGEQPITFTINQYGNNSGETLTLDFEGGKSSFRNDSFADTNAFKEKMIVKDQNGNTLSTPNYTVSFAPFGTSDYSEVFPQTVGTYTAKVVGTGVNYAGNYDVATRDFVIYMRTVFLSDTSGEYKNEVYTISDIIDSIVVTSDDDEPIVLDKNNFNISFGSTLAKQVGTYTVIATGKQGTSYDGVIGTGAFTIVPAQIQFTSVTDRPYCGHAHTPVMTVTGVNGDNVLYMRDYTITYSGEIYPASETAPTNAGHYTITVEGLGNYQGKVTREYNITPISFADSTIQIEIANNEQVYNTAQQLPSLNVTYVFDCMSGHGAKRLAASDFELLTSGDDDYIEAKTDIGVIKAKGANYYGTKQFEYTIKPYTGTLDVTLSGDVYENGVTKEEIINHLIVKYQNEIIPSGDLDITFNPNTLTVGSYIVRVTAKDSATNYSDGTNRANGFAQFTIVPATDIDLTISGDQRVYTAHAIVLDDSEIFIDGVSIDELRESNNGLTYEIDGLSGIKDVGTYHITVRVLKGSTEIQNATVDFKVVKKNINDNDLYVRPMADQYYTGSKLYPEYLVAHNSVVLDEDDFEAAIYSDNENVGVATITLVGKGNYEGTRLIHFNIVEASGDIVIELTQSGEVVNNNTYIFDGSAKTPDVSVKYVVGTTETILEEGRDYRVSYEDNINATTMTTKAKAIVTLYGNYSGTVIKEFIINRHSIEDAVVTFGSTAVYNGMVQKPTVSVTHDGLLLNPGIDYRVTYNGSFVDAGTYEVIIEALANTNHYGEIVSEYKIEKFGKNENEILLLNFSGDKSTFDTNITQSVFESRISVIDTNGNVLSNSNYDFTYSSDGTTFTETFPTGVGSYIVRVKGTGTNYAGIYDVAERAFAISVNSIDVSAVEATYKNAVFTIDDIIDQITISSENTTIDKSNFDIKFGTTPKQVAPYTIIATGKEGTAYSGMIGTGSFTIVPAQIQLTSVTDRTYCGHSHEPEMTIAGVANEELQNLKDYTIEYSGDTYPLSSEAPTDAGHYVVIVEGHGNYAGRVTREYNINPVSMTLNAGGAYIAIELVNNDVVYNTQRQEPDVNVTYVSGHGAKRLTSADFEISGDGFTNAGTYNVQIVAKPNSNYVDSKAFTYTIKPYTGMVNVSLSEDEYINGVTEEEIISNLTVRYLNDVIQNSDLDIEFTPSDLIVGANIISVTAKDSNTNYNDGTNGATGFAQFIIKPASDITVTISGDQRVYTAHTIVLGDEEIFIDGVSIHDLRESGNGLTYEISGITGIKDVGTYPITVRVLKGTKELQKATANFTITPKDINSNDIVADNIPDQFYSGLELEPSFRLTYNGEVLTADDYIVVYKDNVNAGVATITLVGKGNYEGTRNINFNIKELSEGDIIVTLTESGDEVTNSTYTYDGIAKTPDVSVSYVVSGDTTLLELNRDYTLTFEDNTNSGTAKAIVTLCGNYSGTKEKEFIINKFNLADTNVTLVDSVGYNGSEQKPGAYVRRGSVLITAGVDYIITYVGSYVDAGEYDVVLTPAPNSNYQGEKTVHYNILKYGQNENELLLLKFSGDIATFDTNTTQQVFESKLMVKDTYGNVMPSTVYTVSYSADGTTFTENFPTGVGNYVVRVTGTGTNYAGIYDTAERDFIITVNSIDVSNAEATYKNAAFTINDIISQITISSDNTTIDKSNFDISFGNTTPKQAGSYTVIATGKSSTVYEGMSGTGTFTIVPAQIQFISVTDRTYCGHSHIPEMTIAGVANDEVANLKDYTIEYSGDSYPVTSEPPADAGQYKVTVKGLGNYQGKVTRTYNINPVSMTLDESGAYIAIELVNNDVVYNTQKQEPVVNVTYVSGHGAKRLTSADFEISGDSFTNAGTYTARIVAKPNSNYVDSKEFTYTIKPYTGALNVTLSEDEYVNGVSKEEIINNLAIKYINETISSEDVDIVFSPAELTVGANVVRVTAKTSNTNFNNGTNGANGYAQFTINPASDITVTISGDHSVYTAQTVALDDKDIFIDGVSIDTLRASDNGLTYVIEGLNGIKNVGTYTITVRVLKGTNELQSATATYTVTKKDIGLEDVVVDNIADQIYSGLELEPPFRLTYRGEVLTSNDYTVVYKDNINVGEATITLVGQGNYSGTRDLHFNIREISEGDIIITLTEGGEEVTNTTYTYDDDAKTPQVSVSYVVGGDAEVLTENRDYTVSYENNINAGTAKAKVTLCGNYSGSGDKEFVINKFNLANTNVTLIDDVVYNGSEQKPGAYVRRGSVLITAGVDYNITYVGSFVDANEYDVVLTPAPNSNYQGEKTVHYNILKYGQNENEILLLKFNGDKATFDTNITKQEFESKLMVKDTYGNILPGSIYNVTYSTDGSTFTSTFPTDIGSYIVRVTGNGKNYAGIYDVGEREFMISVEVVDVSNVSATYKNAEYTIDDIIDQIKIFVNNVEMPKDNFDIALGVSNPKQAGAYTIITIGKQGTAYESMGGTGTFTIEPAEIQFTSVTDRTYCGHSHDPEMIVAGVNEEQVLINKDYTVTYSGDNYSSTTAPTDAGHYSVTVSGLGDYQGQVTRSYNINPVSMTLDEGGAYIAVELVNNDVVYNTQKQMPVVNVTYVSGHGAKRLTNADFAIASGDFVNADTYTARVIAKSANYKDSKEFTYTIKPYTGALNVTLSEDEYVNGITEEEIIDNLTVKYLNEVISNDDLDIEFNPSDLTVGNSIIRVTAKDSNANYSDGTDAASGYALFSIRGADGIEIVLDEDESVYTAHEILITKDDVIISGDGTVSEVEARPENADLTYTLEVGTIKDVGTYDVVLKISKDENLLQQAITTFKVTAKDISDSDVVASAISDQVFTGDELEPTFTLTYSGEVLDEDDFSAVYKNNIDVGEASIKLVGTGNYKGTKTITFDIVTEQGEITVELYEGGSLVTDSTYTYDGTAKTPEVKVKLGTRLLEQGTDYSVNYSNNVNSTTSAKAQVILKGNFSGNKEVTFKINKADLDDIDITLSSNVVYNGSEQKPSVTVTYGNVLLRENTDYEVDYDGAFTNAGTYDLTITAKDNSNYDGEVTKQFTISKYGSNSSEVLLLEFADGKTSYKEDVTESTFENNLVVKDMNGNVLSSGDYIITYSTSDNEYPEEAGSYTVTVTGTGTNYAGSNDTASRAFVMFVESVNVNDIEKPFKNAVYEIDDIIGEITIKSDVNTDLPKDNFEVSFGSATPKEAGKYTIIVSGKSGTEYEGLLGTSEFTITAVTTFTVTDIEDVDFTGSASKPSIVVKGVNDSTLTEGKDYIVTYTGTDVNGDSYNSTTPPTKVGEYTATVTGIGNYAGAVGTKSFDVKAVDDENIDATLSQSTFIHNETNQVPVEIVKYITTDNTILLVSGTDYDVSYKDGSGDPIAKANIIEVGEYQVVITLKGNYNGTKVLDFEIVEAEIDSLNISVKDNSKEYNKEPQGIELLVKDSKGNVLEENTDYKVTYYKDAEFNTPTGTSDGAEGEGKAPANSGKYYVKIEGLDNYDAVSSDATFIITKKSVDDLTVLDIDDQLFDNTAKEPSVTVKDGSDVISPDEYTVTYKNNIKLGEDTASATIKFKDDSNYKGTKVVNFSIISNADEEVVIELKDKNGDQVSDSTYTYDGTEKKPEVVVTCGEAILEEGKDYTISYANNKNAGTATAKVTLKGEYSGTVSANFKINPLDISEAEVTAKPEKTVYTGSNVQPPFTVSIQTEDGKYLKLKENEFEVEYPAKSKNVGKYEVTITATSDNFTGTTKGTFEVYKEKETSGGGGGNGGAVVYKDKIVEVEKQTSGDKQELSDTSLLDKVNHYSYITGYDDATFMPDKVMTRAEVVTVFVRLLKVRPLFEDDNIFTDIDGHWAKDDIITMSKLGIVKGYEDGTFLPDNSITRAEFATIITRFDKIVNHDYKSSFVDVTKEHWAYDTINYAKLMGWISGYEDGTFKPDDYIKRAEAITIINRMLGRIGDIDKINSNKSWDTFTDIDGHWAYYGILEATISHEYEFDGKVEIWK